MEKKKDLYSDTRNILNKIFESREDELYNISKEELNLITKKSNYYSKIDIAIDNVPPVFKETKANIKMVIETYIETCNKIQAIEGERLYKEGFCDAINLIVNCLINKNK